MRSASLSSVSLSQLERPESHSKLTWLFGRPRVCGEQGRISAWKWIFWALILNHPVLPSTGWAAAPTVTFRSVGISASMLCGQICSLSQSSLNLKAIMQDEGLYTPLLSPSASVWSSVDGNISEFNKESMFLINWPNIRPNEESSSDSVSLS